MDMTHKFGVGINVYFEPRFGDAAARGKYKIVRQLPIENDNRLAYRIKSLAEILRAHRRRAPAAPQRLSAGRARRGPGNGRRLSPSSGRSRSRSREREIGANAP